MAGLVVANWKMYKTSSEAKEFFEELLPIVRDEQKEMVVCPPAVFLPLAAKITLGSNVQIGSQNVHHELQGQFTGEISVQMIKEYCSYVIVGHSERRPFESEEVVAAKLRLVLSSGLWAILCIGERLEQRELGETAQVIRRQMTTALEGCSKEALAKLVVAYEPVWAIGTGVSANAEQTGQVHALIREMLDSRFVKARIIYGGSVTPEDVGQIMRMQNVDGVLVGGASLNANAFAEIVKSS
ncbi:MAG: triose-phosphate isomerase [Candidatus Woesearchaeota archaeon]